MEKYLVTGAAGNIGSSMVRRLIKEKKSVRIFILKGTWHEFLDGLDVEICYGDVTKKADVERAVKGCTHLFHFAGIVSYCKKDRDLIYAVNVGGMKLMLEAAKKFKVQRIVVTISTSGLGVPGRGEWPLHEDSPFDPKWHRIPYLDSKKQGLEMCKEFASRGVPVVMVSPTTVYGAGDTAGHIGRIIHKIEHGCFFVPPGGNAVVAVDDVIGGHWLAMQKGDVGENYVLANEFLTEKELYGVIAKLVQASPPRFVIPRWFEPVHLFWYQIREFIALLLGKKPAVACDGMKLQYEDRYFDSTKARKELGWVPRVSFEQAMEDAVEFHRKLEQKSN